jgi:CubicO group peptidase (beta-lactamase class C family)
VASQCQIAPRPESLSLDSGRLEELVAQAQACVEEAGLPSAQIALARDGALAVLCTLDGGGERARPPAGNDTLYAAFSATKAVTASAAWILLQEGGLRLDEPVAHAIPEFASHGKGAVTLRHLLAHTAGFPNAPFEPLEWDDPARRLARFAQWRLEWPPGTRFQYHPASSMWVVAALIERRAGIDFRAFVRERVARPLGLARLHLGLPAELDARVAEIVHVGEAPSAERLAAVGLRLPAEIVGDELAMERYNLRAYRAVGTPGGGAVLNAGDLALFYQALLRDGRAPDGARVWTADVLAEARRVQTGDLRDPMTGRLASRGLGIVIAGDETRVYRAFAPEHSPAAFGHPGAGGQLAWADPECGLSFAWLTNGIDRNALRVGGRNLALSNAALACVRC